MQQLDKAQNGAKRKANRSYRPRVQHQHRFAVSRLRTSRTVDEGQNSVKGDFQNQVCAELGQDWTNTKTVEGKWSVMKSALVETATSVLGNELRKHPDWFRDNMEVLEPLLQKRNNLYIKWLGTSNTLDHQMFAEARRKARLAVRTAENKWFVAKAEEALNESLMEICGNA